MRSSDVDASYGGEEFQKEKIARRGWIFFMKYNIRAFQRNHALTGNTLFPIRTEGSSVLRTLLLTDENGLGFPGSGRTKSEKRCRNRTCGRVSGKPEKISENGKEPEGLRKAGERSRERRLLKLKRRRLRKKRLPAEAPGTEDGTCCASGSGRKRASR